ncbi:hypothetical protein LWC35_19495 [Pseudonocardia kujensis]|uniref:hypothetical protein n=1 Tax=Pseudonocardia kujensis TaxID=1128675 RepID=UPI001E420CA6|nr:hypothetical protein [Pseudonocardia kujensis]MCE0765065.1 hypothetical protein [Pseudonocardia kujensis]
MTTSRAEAERVSAALTDALQSADRDRLEAVIDPAATLWHNTDQVESTGAELVTAVVDIGAVCSISLSVGRVGVTDTGFLQTQEWTFRTAAGAALTIHSSFDITLGPDGRVIRLDEYVDSSALTALGELVADGARHAASAVT